MPDGEPVPRLGKARTLDKVGTWPLHSLQPLALVLPWILAWANSSDLEHGVLFTLQDSCLLLHLPNSLR